MAKLKMVDVEEEIVPTETPKIVDSSFFPIDDLPSRYLKYPKGTKLFGRPLKVKEIKRLSAMNEDNYNSIINEVLTNCIQGLPIEEIYVADKLYLIFWLRANTYKNANFSTTYHCHSCKEKNEFTFDVDSFSVNYLEEFMDFKDLTLLNSQDIISFDYPKIRDEGRIAFLKDNLRNSRMQIDEDTISTASYIKTINGKEISLQRACEFLLNLDSAEDYAFIMSHIEENEFGVSPEVKVHCHKCKEINHLPFSFRQDFFLPKYQFR